MSGSDRGWFNADYCEHRCPVCTRARKGNRFARFLQAIEMIVTFGGCPYDPTTTVSIALAAEELRAILTETRIASTKNLRPRLEAVGEGEQLDLAVGDWGSVCLALCGARTEEVRVRKHLLGIAVKIANRLAEALGIAAPPAWIEKKCR